MLIRPVLTALGATLLIAACSGGAAIDGPRAPATEQTCTVVGADLERVDPAAVLGVEGILEVASSLVPEGGSFPYTEFSVPLQREGAGDGASEDDGTPFVPGEAAGSGSEQESRSLARATHLLVSELPEQAVIRLRDAIDNGRLETAGDGLPSRFRLRIDEGPEGLRLGTERSQACAPRLADPRQLSRELQSLARNLPAGGYEVQMVVFVGADGKVENAQIAAPAGGFPGRVQLISMITRQRFHPALQDGIPIPAWARFPVNLR